MKNCLPSGKSKNSANVLAFKRFKANLILLANTQTPGPYTDSWPYQVSLRVTTRRPVTFAVGRLKLH